MDNFKRLRAKPPLQKNEKKPAARVRIVGDSTRYSSGIRLGRNGGVHHQAPPTTEGTRTGDAGVPPDTGGASADMQQAGPEMYEGGRSTKDFAGDGRMYGCTQVPGPATSAPPGSRYQQKCQAAEANWESFQCLAREHYFSTQPQRAQVQREQHSAHFEQLMAAVNDVACPVCGLHAEQCNLIRTVAVAVVDLKATCIIPVPVFTCIR